MTELVPAVGGTRLVPAPDPVARDYLLLALRLDQHRSGLVDAYYGPADLKAQADMESLRPPARLADDAAALRDRLAIEVDDPERREWFRAQLVALEAQSRDIAGEPIPYDSLVAQSFDGPVARMDDSIFDAAAHDLDELLPGDGPLDPRLSSWDEMLMIDPERVPAVVEHLNSTFRARAGELFGLPDGETIQVSMVRDRPWSGANWYDGGRKSRVEINLDLGVTVGALARLVAHETYFGHHLEASIKEAGLVGEQGRTELTLASINTPECLLREGLAELGYRFAVPAADEGTLLLELFEVAGLRVAGDPAAARAVADTQARVGRAREILRWIGGNAALLRHVDGMSREDVIDYVLTVGQLSQARADQLLDHYIDQAIGRIFIFTYREGEQLLGDWLEQVPEPERAARFGRLLAMTPTPSSIRSEVSPPSGNP